MRNSLKTKSYESDMFMAHSQFDESPVRDSRLQDVHDIDERILFTERSLNKPNREPGSMHELRIESFPVWYFSTVDASTAEIANVLDILVRDYQERFDVEGLLIPSVIELSLYFQCPEVQVYDAFEMLKRKQYRLSYDANCSKVYVLKRQFSAVEGWEQAADDGIDWRDITHDFYTDVVQPVKQKLATLFG
ncbi:MAG: hypothetical protein VKJ04_11135 [Vampirovibrionales bacterium]|nr:hypothetical protein [Vampirovibrionales bacterium]